MCFLVAADSDHNGTLSKEEWVALIDKLIDDRTPDTADKALDKFVSAKAKQKDDKVHSSVLDEKGK